MAILVECTTVILRNATVRSCFPGGLEEYERRCPNSTYCSDESICRVAFMVPADAETFVRGLAAHGIKKPSPDAATDVVIVDQQNGCLQPCDWLETDLRTFTTPDGGRFGATIAWLKGEEPTTFVAPPNWTPGSVERVSLEELKSGYDFVEVRDGVEAFRHKETGKVLYVGRPNLVKTAEWKKRYSDLADEVRELEHDASGVDQGILGRRARSCHERAAQLVSETSAMEPGPLMLLGISARLMNQWESAESAFRKVTELSPEVVGAWLELTWALASLERLEQAETSARRAVALDSNRADTLGNLASVLLQKGDLGAALQAIRRALDIDAEDSINQNILAEIRRRQPWYRKIWRK